MEKMSLKKGLQDQAYQNGYEVHNEKGTVVLGMSLGNSYFNKDTIDQLVQFSYQNYSQVRVMIPDLPAIHTYKAIGYCKAKAQRKARLNGNTLQNHAQASIDRILEQDSRANIKLIEWEDEIEKNQTYQKEYQNMLELYQTNTSFKQDVRGTTGEVIKEKLKPRVKLEEAVNEAIRYLLKELAFLSASPQMLGAEKVAYVYHDRWKIFEELVEGKYTGEKRKDLGFLIIKPSERPT